MLKKAKQQKSSLASFRKSGNFGKNLNQHPVNMKHFMKFKKGKPPQLSKHQPLSYPNSERKKLEGKDKRYRRNIPTTAASTSTLTNKGATKKP